MTDPFDRITDAMERLVAAARREERERCAKLLDGMANTYEIENQVITSSVVRAYRAAATKIRKLE